MKRKYFIGQAHIDWSDDRWLYKGGWGMSPKRRKGYIGLWDRNCYRFWWFKIVEKTMNKYGYIVERAPNFGKYWKSSIKEVLE